MQKRIWLCFEKPNNSLKTTFCADIRKTYILNELHCNDIFRVAPYIYMRKKSHNKIVIDIKRAQENRLFFVCELNSF